MRPEVLNPLFFALVLAGLGVGARLVARPLAQVEAVEPAPLNPPNSRPGVVRARDSLGAAILARDPFRVTRRVALIAYDPVQGAPSQAPARPRPILTLTGVVWDRVTPTALVEGFPGVDGPRVVRRGDAVGGIRVEAIRQDRIVLVGQDTVWNLAVREPWK